MLKNLQGKFKDAVLYGKKESFLPEIEEGGKIGPEQRLYIYSHAYKARLKETLEEDFPVLHSMVGDQMFGEICSEYIDQHPSKHPSLRYFGKHMTKFLSGHQNYSELIPAIEMAEYEWVFNDVFDAPDRDAITINDVAEIAPEAWTTLRMTLQPSFRMHKQKWNTAAIWSAVTSEEMPPTPQEFEEVISTIQWKADLNCFFRSVENDEAGALNLIIEGKAFPDLCEFLMDDHGENATMRAAALFRNWVEEGLITDLEYLQI